MRRTVGIGHDLRDPVMIAQIDEEQVTVVALAVNPSGQADSFADVGSAQFSAFMRTIYMLGHAQG